MASRCKKAKFFKGATSPSFYCRTCQDTGDFKGAMDVPKQTGDAAIGCGGAFQCFGEKPVNLGRVTD